MWEQEARPKRNPYCSRCRNHGKSAQVKGHKRHCEYRYCQCEGCKLVMCRQIVSAAQIKRRRYQKQDEECGRRIEVSPPVLTRTANSDPATLIAKTLIGSTRNAVASSKAQLEVGVSAPPPPPQPSAQTMGPTQLQTQLQNHMMSLPAFHSTSGTSLSDALHLFQFTAAFSQQHANPSNLLISASNGGNSGGGGGGGSSGSGSSSGPSSALLSGPNSSLMCGGGGSGGPREQFNIVEDLHQTFGPLAIFAWLQSEGFNVTKIRTLIDMAKVSYDALLQLNGHSALDLTSPIVDI